MNSKRFFRYCREMVEFRWVCLIMPNSEIEVVLRVNQVNEIETPFPQPICSVANDVLGFSPRSPRDVFKAGNLLGLSDEFAHMVIEASQGGPISPEIVPVRQELIESLRPVPLYEPEPNLIRAPIIAFGK